MGPMNDTSEGRMTDAETNLNCSKQCLRILELQCYAAVVSTLRAQGDLSSEKRRLLYEIQKLLNVTPERHKAEVRRAANDEELESIAKKLNTGIDVTLNWLCEGRTLGNFVPETRNRGYLLPELTRKLSATANSNQTAFETAESSRKISPDIKAAIYSQPVVFPSISTETIEEPPNLPTPETLTSQMKTATTNKLLAPRKQALRTITSASPDAFPVITDTAQRARAIEASKQKTKGTKRKSDPEPFFTYADHPVIKLAPKRKNDDAVMQLQSGSIGSSKASPIAALIRHSHSILPDSSAKSGSSKTMQISTPTGNRVILLSGKSAKHGISNMK